MCGQGGDRGSGPPWKITSYMGSIEISIWTTPLEKVGPPPPLENVGPPLVPWKSIVFSVIKQLDMVDPLY